MSLENFFIIAEKGNYKTVKVEIRKPREHGEHGGQDFYSDKVYLVG